MRAVERTCAVCQILVPGPVGAPVSTSALGWINTSVGVEAVTALLSASGPKCESPGDYTVQAGGLSGRGMPGGAVERTTPEWRGALHELSVSGWRGRRFPRR